MLVGNTNFYNKFVNFSLNITKFGMLIDIVEIDKSRDFGCYRNLIYKNVCIYKLGWAGAASIH